MRAARALALVIAVMVSASLLAGLSYLMPSLFHRGRIIIRAYAIGSDGSPTQLTNASFSVWAWAPTPNGTEFIPVYNGTGPQAVINLARLVGWAKDWIHAYGKAAIRSLEPSIIIWVSYPIALPNGSVVLVTQPSFQPINLSLPLSGNGTIIDVMVSHPFRNLLKASGRGARAAARGLGGASPEQGTVTVPINTSFTYCGMPCYLVPHVMFWYPNNEGMAPISLAVALAQPSSVSGAADVVISITEASQYANQYAINGLMTPGSAVEAAIGEYEEIGNLPQVLSQFYAQLETTFTFSTGEVQEGNSIEAYVPLQNEKGPDIGQLYIVGQAALVNWTLQSPSGATVGWYLGLQLTEVEVMGIDNVEVPVIYNWWAYDPCVNPSEWAWEQQLLMQDPGDFYGYGINSTYCPLPNTPAPVIWEDYATKLTYFDIVNPYQVSYASYVDLSVGVNGAKSPLGIAIDLGSAIVKSAEPAVSLASPEAGDILKVIGALLGSFQYQSNAVAVTVNTITIANPYLHHYVSVYYSNLTPVYYTVSGYGFTLPNELILINVTS